MPLKMRKAAYHERSKPLPDKHMSIRNFLPKFEYKSQDIDAVEEKES